MTRVGARIAAVGTRLRHMRRRSLLLSGAVLTLLTAAACNSTNTYPIDFFSEMHHQQSWHSQEPPRLSQPVSSVAFGSDQVLDTARLITMQEAAALENPLDDSQENADRGAELFALNCVACHGETGQGDGFMSAYAQFYTDQGVNPPANLTDPAIQGLSDGEIFWVVTNGLNRMPEFGTLLTPEERWQLVLHVRNLGG